MNNDEDTDVRRRIRKVNCLLQPSLFSPGFVYVNTGHADNKPSENVVITVLITGKQTQDNTQTPNTTSGIYMYKT